MFSISTIGHGIDSNEGCDLDSKEDFRDWRYDTLGPEKLKIPRYW